jgi:hypothetical protein
MRKIGPLSIIHAARMRKKRQRFICYSWNWLHPHQCCVYRTLDPDLTNNYWVQNTNFLSFD